jgi:hypothetical protein
MQRGQAVPASLVCQPVLPASSHLPPHIFQAVHRFLAAHFLQQADMRTQVIQLLIIGCRHSLERCRVDLPHQLLRIGGTAAWTEGAQQGAAGGMHAEQNKKGFTLSCLAADCRRCCST